jgi:hypothetical protein
MSSNLWGNSAGSLVCVLFVTSLNTQFGSFRFIDKVIAKYNLVEGATTSPEFPMADTQLQPYTGVVEKALKKRYQQLVDSMAYISVFTRPDISLTHSILSCYLTSPG